MDPGSIPLSPDEETVFPEQTIGTQRSLKSLRLFTTRFVKTIQEAEGAELDLREVFSLLDMRKKRRIYDITNVLEGVGLLEKTSKSRVKWKGTIPPENSQELNIKLMELRSELEDLELKEHTLDQQKFWVEQSIRNTTEDCSHLTYINHDDVCDCFSGQTLLAVEAPQGTQLDVPIPKAVLNSPAKYQIHLKSINGPIDVVILNKSSVSCVPLVLPVPPPEDVLQKAKSLMSHETESDRLPCQASGNAQHNAKPRWPAKEDFRYLLLSSLLNNEPQRSESDMQFLSKELGNLLQTNKQKNRTNIFTERLNSEGFAPPLRLSPPPSELDYNFQMDESDGLSDLFDVPMLNV
ncbi:transcription factor E2F5-like [Notolabrus celidotus]|uniref:transcription factor E2F5-like n=1 Tax=Notolabrus celidotus TaxID=1203425 RepID=UPI00149054AA|nr:transcription factor E2F5-like [Notolabrus celidotus]